MPKKNPYNKRSKLEKYIESRLKTLYPNIRISFNNRKALGGPELDIYIPKLRLAFELNGEHHFSPIYGLEKLAQIQAQDTRKISLSKELGIDLVVVDTRKANPFSNELGEAFLRVLQREINSRLPT